MKRFGFFIMMCLLTSVGAWADTLKGKVIDQNAQPVVGATITCLNHSESDNSLLASTTSDADGNWELNYEHTWQDIQIKATKEGHTSYTTYLDVSMRHTWPKFIFRLINALDYEAGKRSTIYLPVAPHSSWGRFYRLDREEENKVIFERELAPKAYVPYVFFPYQDLHIDISGMDLSDHRNRVNLQRISLYGQINYMASEADPGSLITWLLDESLSYVKYSEEGAYENSGFLPPMHAILSWMYTDFFEGNDEDGTWEAVDPELVFHDSEEDIPTYHPFVERGKKWCVHGFSMGGDHTVTDYYFSEEEILFERNGHFYEQLRTRTQDGKDELVGWFREENQRVYIYNDTEDKEVLTYDFSLEEGDRFSPEYGDYSQCEVKEVSYKDVNGERLKVITFEANDRQIDADVRTQVEWIEGIGHSGGSDPSPLAGLYSKNSPPNSWGYYTAYVLYDNTQDNNYYLPLTFGVPYNGWWGQQPLNTVKMLSLDNSDPELHYELVPDPAHDCYQLHVYGNAIMNCGPNHYAYCIRENGNKLRIQIDDLEPLMDCTGPHHVELYFPFFLAEQHYTVVDERGEHPVTVKQETQTTYRPFIEEGKVWKVGSFPWGLNPDEWDWDEAQIVGTYYFDGDTIVGNQQCKKMMCRYEYGELGINWGGIPSTEYEGALYELDRKVYLAYPNQETFVLLYDFAASEGNFIEFYDTEKQQETNAIIGTKKQSESEKFHGIETELYIKVKDSHQYAYLNYEVNWREGIGYNCLQNTEEFERIGGARKFLMSCYIGDEVLYYDSTLKDGTITDSEVKKNWLDFTHTVKTKPKAPRRGEAAASDEETVTGEYSIKELFVNFKTLTGPYTITVTDAAGQTIYNKVVQTSNVVALNMDISNYPKGSYTITIENENEVYSAEFKVGDEDGLAPTLSPVRQGSIYNLKGQRLTQPQRGVNIINGRKVVVK